MDQMVILINNVHRELIKLVVRTEYDISGKNIISRTYTSIFQSGRINKSNKQSRAIKYYMSWFDQPTHTESYCIDSKQIVEEIYEESKRVVESQYY